MKPSTRKWVFKAEKDWLEAQRNSRSKVPLHDGVCFHCQQCAEKYLKALLEELGAAIPRTHNLDDLLNLLSSQHPTLLPLRRGLIYLTDFAVPTRYPGFIASKRQADSALRWAGRVREKCRKLLGIKTTKRKRR